MKNPEFYITEVDLSLDVEPGEIYFGITEYELEIDEEPKFTKEKRELETEFTLSGVLNKYPRPIQDTNQNEEEVGDFEVEAIITVHGDETEFEDYLEVWKDEGYKSLPGDFRYHIESGFMTEVLSPIAGLVDNSFRGILPGLRFTGTLEEERRAEIDLEDRKKEFLEYAIERELIGILNGGLEIEVESMESTEVMISEDEKGVIEINLGSDIKEKIEENEEIQDRVQKATSEIVTEIMEEPVSVKPFGLFSSEE
jgi:hypothetical protein